MTTHPINFGKKAQEATCATWQACKSTNSSASLTSCTWPKQQTVFVKPTKVSPCHVTGFQCVVIHFGSNRHYRNRKKKIHAGQLAHTLQQPVSSN